MRIATSKELLLVSLPAGTLSTLSTEPLAHHQDAANEPNHAADSQRVAQVFQLGTRLLIINDANVLESDRPTLRRILRERAGMEPTIAILTLPSFHAGFISAVTLEARKRSGAFAPSWRPVPKGRRLHACARSDGRAPSG